MNLAALLWALALCLLLQPVQSFSAVDYFKDRFGKDKPAPAEKVTDNKVVSRFSSYFTKSANANENKANLRGSKNRRAEVPESEVASLKSAGQLALAAVEKMDELQARHERNDREAAAARAAEDSLNQLIRNKVQSREHNEVWKDAARARDPQKRKSRHAEDPEDDLVRFSQSYLNGMKRRDIKIDGVNMGENAAPPIDMPRAGANNAAIIQDIAKNKGQSAAEEAAADAPNQAKNKWWQSWKGYGKDIIKSGVLRNGINVAQINDKSAMGVNKAAAAAAAEKPIPDV